MEDSISLEETNRHRISLGLKPIPVPGAPPVKREPSTASSGDVSEEARHRLRQSLGLEQQKSREEVEFDNWQAKTKEDDAKLRQSEIESRLAVAAERRARRKRLAGTGLGEQGDDDNTSFLKNINKKRKRPRVEISREEDEDDREEYTAKDMAGMKIGHSLEDFQGEGEGEQVILTLKDTDVLDEDGEDILESATLNEQLKQRASDKVRKGTQRKAYDDQTDFYAEEKEENFVLGEDGVIKGTAAATTTAAAAAAARAKKEKERVKVSFSFLNDEEEDELPTSDYKRAKKSKSKGKSRSKEGSRRVKLESEEPEDDKRHLTNNVGKKLSLQEVDDLLLDDDADLRLSMRRTLLKSQKSKKKLTPEELAERLTAEREAKEEEVKKEQEEGDEIVLNDTTDFLSGLRRAVAVKEEEEEDEMAIKSEDITVKAEDVEFEADTSQSADVKMESVEPEDHAASEETHVEPEAEPVADDLLNEEDTSVGTGGLLKMLRSRGLVQSVTPEERERQRVLSEQREWRRKEEKQQILREIAIRQERERREKEGVYDGLTRREREEAEAREDQLRLQREARADEKRFENYEPEINLQYYDDHGQKLDTKEAYKYLSHQFHGKGPGKASVERSLKKSEEARNKERLAHERNQAPSSSRSNAGTRLG